MLKTEGIVFRITRFKESSLIMDVYTESHGLQTFFMNSVYTKSNQRLASLFQLMNLVELIAYFNENKEMHRIKEVNPLIIYNKIPFDIKRSAIGTFILEICRNSIKGQQSNSELFQFIKNIFIKLDISEQLDPYLHFHFLLDFSKILGFHPLNNYSHINNSFDTMNGVFVPYSSSALNIINPKDSELLSKFFNNTPPSEFLTNLKDKRNLLQYLILLFKYHIDQFKEIKSIDVFKGIF